MSRLLAPIDIRSLRLKNRIVLPPMATGKASEEGEVTDDLIEHYKNYSRDVGLIIVEHSYVLPGGKYSDNQLGIDRDELIPGLTSLAKEITDENSGGIIQLNHAGLKAGEVKLNLLDFDYEGSLTKYSLEDIEEFVDGFVEASRRAVEAGFDGVEIHGAHGFLLSQFISPITNDRRDRFGGSFENRIRLPLRLVEEIRDEIGNKVLAFRIGATDLDPRGVTIEESKQLATRLIDSGVDLLDVSGGLCGSRPDELEDDEGYFVNYACMIRESVNCPVIGVGGIGDPIYANDLVESNKLDLIAVGRAQLSNSDWASEAKKVLEGNNS